MRFELNIKVENHPLWFTLEEGKRQTCRVFKIRMIFEIILLSIFDRRMIMYKEEYCVLMVSKNKSHHVPIKNLLGSFKGVMDIC